MSRGDVGLVLGLAGFLLGAFAVYESRSMKSDVASLVNERKQDEDSLTGLGGRLDRVDTAQKDLTRRVNELDAGPRGRNDRLQAIENRIAALECGVPAEGRGPSTPDVATHPADTAPHKLTPEEIDALEKKLDEGTATDADKAKLQEALDALEAGVKERPRDVQAHLQLADWYIRKLMTVPEGMERGAWSMKAVGEWRKVLEIDPDNWAAHHALGSNYSFWPEQFNKRPEAIKEFEAARKVQEQSTPDPKFADTYVQLRLLYLKEGKTDEAKAVLEEGLRRFPDDEELQKLK